MALIKIFCIVSAFAIIANAQQIRMFDHNDYGGFEHASQITTSCETLPQWSWNKVASIKNEKCVLLYSHPDCTGNIYRLEAGEHSSLPYFYDDTDSFRSCSDITEETQYRDLRTKFYDHANYGNIQIDLPISTGCQNLPDWAWNRVSSLKTDICVILYSDADCSGREFRVERGDQNSLPYFNDDTDSYKPCDANEVLKDYRLTVKIIKFEIKEGDSGSPGEDDLDMGATQTFRNNGSATIVQRYTVSKQVTEVVDMERVVGTTDFHRFYVDVDASFSYSLGIPVIAQTKVSGSLKTGYLFERNTTEVITERYRNETVKGFKVEQDIQVPPCTVYEVASIVKLSTNYPVDYVAQAYVTGEYTGHLLSAAEVRSRLGDDMTYVRDVDANTVEVTFIRSLKADFGLSTETNGDGHPIEGCLSLEEDPQNL